MTDLSYLPEHLARLAQGFSPAQLQKLQRQMATKLRREQSKRITAQQNVDGSSYEVRKPQRPKKGKRVRAKMMNTIKNAAHMRIKHRTDGFDIGYTGRMAQIASVHQYGLTSRVDARRGTTAAYPVRELIGISDENKQMLDEMMIEYFEGVLNG